MGGRSGIADGDGLTLLLPVTIVTGFLGSGKTTLIARLLRNPAFARTAVIVNEFGEIGLDHELVAASDEQLLTLSTGCLCCAVRGDLLATLLDLQARRAAGEIAYDRVLIETSGLADPAPILQALMTDRDVSQHYAIDTMITLVDAQHGALALDRHPEARRQVALADRLLLTKIDIAGDTEPLLGRLAALNPGAQLLQAVASDIAPDALFAHADPAARAARFTTLPDRTTPSVFAPAAHSGGIATFSLLRDTPLPALALTLWLEALVEHCGERLLRMKGLVNVAEMPGRPALIHGVRHVFAAPEWLDRWPSADQRTRIVFIAEGVPQHFQARLLDAIEDEVVDETRRQKWN
jgi:G3E family GTPase